MCSHLTKVHLAGMILLLPVLPVHVAQAISPDIVISQVYGGGGNSGATYTNDFIELFNRGSVSVNIAGWSVQYASATGTSWQVSSLSGAIQPGQYYLVQEGAGAGGTMPLPTPDGMGSIAMSATTGKVALVNSSTALSGTCPLDASIVDMVGYGGTASCFEGSGPAPGPSNTTADARVANGCTDTDNNTADFTAGSPDPRNTASPVNPCAAPALVINEIDYDQPGTDTAEFIEIKNAGTSAANLANVTLELVNGNGGGAAVYQTINLPAVTLAAGDYFVVCANKATVANCDLDVDPDTNLIQNGAPDAVGLRFFDGTLLDAVSYEGDTGAPYTEGSGAGLEDAGVDGSLSRCPDGNDTNQNNTDFVFTATGTPGAANACPGACGDPSTPIHTVQGDGLSSPLAGTEVSLEAIVTGDFQNNASPDNGDLNGFYLQEADDDADAEPATSEGIFVFAPGAVDVGVGDRVRVHGTVAESGGMTEINNVTSVLQCSTGNSLPAAAALSLPVSDTNDFEPYEGMRVTFPQALYISEYFNFDRYNEILLTSVRHLAPTAEFQPGASAIQAAQDIQLDRITLDDGRTAQNPDPAIHPNGAIFDLSNRFRGGDTVQNVTGVLDYSSGVYRIQPTQGADYVPVNLRAAQPAYVGSNLKVASFNAQNYFVTLDNGADICGPKAEKECRGADNQNEFERQRAKILAALEGIDADVLGLVSIENAPGDAPVADLATGLNDALGAGSYTYIATGPIGADAIRVALLYKPETVEPVGNFAVLDASVDARFNDTKNRPTLAQTFRDKSTGGVFTVAVNDFKTKGSACDDVGDRDTGDGSGNCNLTRKNAAAALVDWLATDPTGSGDGDFLIIGDLNAYAKEDPIDTIRAGEDNSPGNGDDYTDLISHYHGEDAYSYVFDGQLGYLDHALASADLVDQITGVTIWHINADEPDLIDYDTLFKKPAQQALYAPDAYRSSDHDPVIVGLAVCDQIAPTFDQMSVTPGVLWPASHKYVDVTATVAASDNFDPSPVVTLVSVTSNEPDNGDDDGDTVNDIVIVDEYHFSLRAERSGIGTGRIYTITYKVTDACGNATTQSVTVTVPLSQGKV